MTLREVLHAHIPLLRPDSTVRDAVDKMDIYQFPALVFIDESHRPIGVITEGDLVRAVTRRDNMTSMASEPAIVHATKEPTTLAGDVEIGDAFHRMVMSGLTVLPVTDEEKLIGMVFRVDLMQAMLMDAAAHAGQ